MNPDESFQAGILAREIRSLFAEAAVRAGVIHASTSIRQVQVDLSTEIVALCARLRDGMPKPAMQPEYDRHCHFGIAA